MSYYVTCYYADTTIKKTYIYSGTTLKKTLTHSGETDDNGDDISFVDEYSGNLRFQATPADGYATTWAYRVDSNKDVLEHHYVDTFPYTNQEGLLIRAEGKKPSSISSLSVSQTQTGVKKARVQFNTSGLTGGKFYIYANKYEKVRGVVTDTVQDPGVIIEFDNFDVYTIEVAVVVGEKMYFGKYGTVNIKDSSSSGGDSGDSGGGDDGDGDTTKEWTLARNTFNEANGTKMTNIDVSAYKLWRIAIDFKYSGTVNVYTVGDVDTIGYFSTSSEWVTGASEPSDFNAYDDNSYDGTKNFYLSRNVQKETPYYIWVKQKTFIESARTILYIECPEEEQVGVEHWDWEIGTGSDRDKAYHAIMNHGFTTDFKHTVWNELVTKVLDVIAADETGPQGWLTDGGKYLTAEETKMSSSDREILASKFNALLYNINQRNYIEIDDKIEGDIVYGDYFKKLADGINGWIDKL